MKLRDKVILKNINDIHMYARNNKKHPDKQIELLAANIKEFGFTNPILLDENNNIIAGHGRYLAAKRLNLSKVPCIELSDLSPTQVKALRIADNRVAELAETDMEMLKIEIDDLEMEDFDIDLLGCDDLNFDIDGDGQEVEEDDYEEPEVIETDIKEGDIIQLGDHRLMCGDSTDYAVVSKLMDGNKADMCFTDPPYLMDFTGGIHADGSKSFNSIHGKIKNDKMSKEDGDKFLDKINAVIKETVIGSFYITFYRLGINNYYNSLERNGLQVRSLIIWEKGNHTLSNSDYMSRYEPIFYGWVNEHNFYGGNNGMDVWFIERTKKNELHPTMKPLELCSKAISDSSKQNGTVLDLFGGSGSTLIACEQLNRKCYMMELDPKYCEVICQRWEKLTGKKREILNG